MRSKDGWEPKIVVDLFTSELLPFSMAMDVVGGTNTIASGAIVSGSYFYGSPISVPEVIETDEWRLKQMVIDKFLRQLISDPAKHALILKHFRSSPELLMFAMFFPNQLYKTAVALETEVLRKQDMEYENKVFMGGPGDASFSIEDRVMGNEEQPLP